MTRDEAITENIKYFRTTLQIQAMTRSEDEIRRMAAAQIDFYVAIGVLKLDEPKNAEQEFSAMLYGYINGPDADAILGGMSQRGLKIVKA